LQEIEGPVGVGRPGPNQPLKLVENHHLPRLRIFTAANMPKIIEIDSCWNGMEHAFYHGNG